MSHYIVMAGQVGLKLTEVCLPLSLEFWDYRCAHYVAQASLELIVQLWVYPSSVVINMSRHAWQEANFLWSLCLYVFILTFNRSFLICYFQPLKAFSRGWEMVQWVKVLRQLKTTWIYIVSLVCWGDCVFSTSHYFTVKPADNLHSNGFLKNLTITKPV